MVNVLEELESFFEYHKIKWEDVTYAQITNYDFDTTEFDDFELKENYTSDDLQSFLNHLKSLNYQGIGCNLQGCIWLTQNRLINRHVVFWCYAEWELKQIPNDLD